MNKWFWLEIAIGITMFAGSYVTGSMLPVIAGYCAFFFAGRLYEMHK